MTFESREDALKFISIFLKHKLLNISEICSILNISEGYFYDNLANNLNPIQLKGSVTKLILDEAEPLGKGIHTVLKNTLHRKTFYLEKNVAQFICLKYEIDKRPISFDEALFLLQDQGQNKWKTLKDIKREKSFDHDRQVYRFLEKPDCPYLVITTKEGSKTSMTRYFRV